MSKRIKLILLFTVIFFAALITYTRVERINPIGFGSHAVNQGMFNDIAINGYDAVAYHTAGRAMQGSPKIMYEWKEADWFFISEEHRQLFVEDPERYVPQYGGYCAFAVSTGFTADTDPETFEIIEGKLYLFNSPSVREQWMSDVQANREVCDKKWNQ